MDDIIDFMADLTGWFTGKSSWRRRSKNARRSCDSNLFTSNGKELSFQRNLAALPSTILKSLGHAPGINGFTYSRDKFGHFISRLERTGSDSLKEVNLTLRFDPEVCVLLA